jgi:hypothetical protein
VAKPSAVTIAALFALTVANVAHAQPHDADAINANAATLLQGTFDNREQMKTPNGDATIPHVTVAIEPTSRKDFSLWHVHLETDATSAFDQTWAMQTRVEHDGSGALVPYYQLKQTTRPLAAAFKPEEWLSLEACALRGDFGTSSRLEGIAEGEPCVAVTMSVGARRALLPVGILREGDVLHIDFNLRGTRTRIDATRD